MPKLWIVGKELRYSDAALSSGDNRRPAFWNDCYNAQIFDSLEERKDLHFDGSHAGVFIDWYLGDGDFSYIVGMLMKAPPTDLQGYDLRELPETEAAVIWVKCKEAAETRTVPFEPIAKALKEIGRSCAKMKWCADVFHSARFKEPDESGCVIVDCYIPLD